jgi:hypothetical protein
MDYFDNSCACETDCPEPAVADTATCSTSGQAAIPVSWVKPPNPDGTDPNCPDAVPCTPACTIDPATVPSGVSPLKPVQVIDNCAGCWPETEEIPTTMQGVTRTIVMGVDPCAKCEENGGGGINPAPPPEPPPDQQTAKLTIDVQHTFVVVSPNPVTVGNTGTVTVTVTNTGTANYTGANPTINIPSGFTVTSQSVSGNLNAGQTKTWTFEVTANAAGNWTTTASVSGKTDSATTSVQAANPAPVASIAPASQEITGAKVGVAIAPTQAFTATGFAGPVTYTWTLSPTSGLTINSGTGVVSGTPNPNMSDAAYTTTVTARSGSQSATAIILVRRVQPA